MVNKGIPTMYKGINFKSMLEAKWAYIFDMLEWSWVYEPFELQGYIPDFVLNFKEPLLVEVKPETTLEGLAKHTKKIEQSGWDKDALIVGSEILGDGWGRAIIGRIGQRGWVEGLYWCKALFVFCHECEQFSFYPEEAGLKCYYGGHRTHNNYYLYELNAALPFWNKAKNIFQYKGNKREKT